MMQYVPADISSIRRNSSAVINPRQPNVKRKTIAARTGEQRTEVRESIVRASSDAFGDAFHRQRCVIYRDPHASCACMRASRRNTKRKSSRACLRGARDEHTGNIKSPFNIFTRAGENDEVSCFLIMQPRAPEPRNSRRGIGEVALPSHFPSWSS